jgi:hypothetical protein
MLRSYWYGCTLTSRPCASGSQAESWHQQRAAELTTLMDQARLEDLLVDTMDRSAYDIAGEILAHTKWLVQ